MVMKFEGSGILLASLGFLMIGADFSKFPSVCFVRYVCGQSLCKALVVKAVPSCDVLIVSVFH